MTSSAVKLGGAIAPLLTIRNEQEYEQAIERLNDLALALNRGLKSSLQTLNYSRRSNYLFMTMISPFLLICTGFCGKSCLFK